MPVAALWDFLLLGRLEAVFLLLVRLGVVFFVLFRLGIELVVRLGVAFLVLPRLGIELFMFIWLGVEFRAVERPKLFVLLREKFPP